MAASGGGDGDDDDDCVMLKCTDPYHPDMQSNHREIIFSISEISSWDLAETLSHQSVTIKANRNRLIQHSSYFRGLLCGSFSESRLDCVQVSWDLKTLLNILKFMFGYSVDIESNNFLPLLEGALFFGVEMLLSKCKAWLIEETSAKDLCLERIQLDDLIHIWSFGVKHAIDFIPEHCSGYLARNFMFAITCESFARVPRDFLVSCINHPDLTMQSEWYLADAIIGWISANEEQSESSSRINDDYGIFFKDIRISLLPLWFVIGKRRCRYFSKFAEKGIDAILNLMSHPFTSMKNNSADNEAHYLKIRLSQYTKKIDLLGCPQLKAKNMLKSILPPPYRTEAMLTTFNKKNAFSNEHHKGDQFLKNLSFGAIEEVEISNCPRLNLEEAANLFYQSFPSLRVLKAAHYLEFNQKELGTLLMSCPSLTEVDLSVDISPLVKSEVSNVSSSSAIASSISTLSLGNNIFTSGSATFYISRPKNMFLNKLILKGRVDVTDNDIINISSFCASLCYLNLRGCTSVTDTGISAVIISCSKLHSLLACDTNFGCHSISAIISDDKDIRGDHNRAKASNFQELQIGGCKGVNSTSLSKLLSQTPNLKSLCLREMKDIDEALYSFLGSSLEMLDVTDTKVSSAVLAHIVSRNAELKCLRAKGCTNLYRQNSMAEYGNFPSSEYSIKWYMKLLETCKLEEIALGWGFSSISLEAMKSAIATVRIINVGLGATLGPDALENLPTICPLLESVILYFQVISDCVVINLIKSLRNLQVLALCHCLGEISPVSFRFIMPNLRRLQLERVTPWMTNDDLVTLIQNFPNLVEISLIGCRLLNSDSQQIISNGWPGLISIHLEDCGEVTANGVSSLFECKAVEDILLRHNGPGIQRNFILHASAVMPMLRKVSVDMCDAVEGDFEIPNFADRRHLSIVKIACCKPQRWGLGLEKSCRKHVHKETLVMVFDSKNLNKVVVKERL